MRPSRIEYRETISFGQYQNATIGVSVEVGPDESPDDALAEAKSWVCDRLQGRARQHEDDDRERFQGERNVAYLRSELSDLNRQVETARERWERMKAFLAKHGVSVDDLELPF